MGSKSSKSNLKTKTKRRVAPQAPIPEWAITTSDVEKEAFLQNLKARTNAGQRWTLFVDRSASQNISIPIMTKMYLKTVGNESVMLCFGANPIELATDIDDAAMQSYHAPFLVAGVQIYLSAKFHYDVVHPKFTMTLNRIRDDLVYAYEGELKVAHWLYKIYLCHAPSPVIPQYAKLRRDDTTVVEKKSRIFWRMGKHPARFIRWEGDGHVVVKRSGYSEKTLFIKDCYIQTNGH